MHTCIQHDPKHCGSNVWGTRSRQKGGGEEDRRQAEAKGEERARGLERAEGTEKAMIAAREGRKEEDVGEEGGEKTAYSARLVPSRVQLRRPERGHGGQGRLAAQGRPLW